MKLNIADNNSAIFLVSSGIVKPEGVILMMSILAGLEMISSMRKIFIGHEKRRGKIMLRMSYKHIRQGTNIKGLNI